MLQRYCSPIAPPLICAAWLAVLLVMGLALGTLPSPGSTSALRTSPHLLLATPAIVKRSAPAPSYAPLAPAPIALPARLP